MSLLRSVGLIDFQVVEVEKVVEKVKEVKKVVEVVDKKQMGIQDGLNELNDTVRAHQQQLENDLKLKQQTLEEGEQQRLESERKLAELQQVGCHSCVCVCTFVCCIGDDRAGALFFPCLLNRVCLA